MPVGVSKIRVTSLGQRLTVTDPMLTTTVVASDLVLFSLTRRLRTVLGRVAVVIAVVAAHFSTVDRIAGIIETSQDFFGAFRPTLALTGARRLAREANRNRELLANVALQVHVGEGTRQRTLQGNQPKVDVVVDQAFLDGLVGRFPIVGLDVFLNCLFGVVHVAFFGSFDQLLPSCLDGEVLNMIAINLTGGRAISANVT